MIPSGNKKILLIYPTMGMSGALVRHIPLSLLYVAVDAIKAGFIIDVIDIRLNPAGWREEIKACVCDNTLLVGISVMTGSPVKSALDTTRWLKGQYPALPVVWGGPHVTFCGAEILEDKNIDFAISSYGSLPLCRLAKYLRGDADALSLEKIPGIVYRDDSSVICSVPPENIFELTDFKDIPYHLIETDLDRYGQLDVAGRIFPIYSSMGCPYHCAFCSSPAQYNGMKKKYIAIPVRDVVDHIECIYKLYQAEYIYFIDDDSFVDIDHVSAIIDEIQQRGIKVKLGFRGARVDEILLMDKQFLSKLAAAGTTILHIGAESGSQRVLEIMRKGCSVHDIIEVNRRLAHYPQIIAAYNFIVGIPGESLDDLRLTRELIMRLLEDNPSAIIFAPNMYRPLPGTELYEVALKHGYRRPVKIEEWIDVEVEGVYQPPWISSEFAREVEMMRVTSYFIDDKPLKLETGKTLRFLLLMLVSRIYGPLARLRFRHGITSFLIEQHVFKWFVRLIRT